MCIANKIATLRNTLPSILLMLDKEEQDDQVVEHDGSKVLLVEKGLSSMVDGLTLDAQDTPDGPKLVISKGRR